MDELEKVKFLTDKGRWIGQLNEYYWQILKTRTVEDLDKANEIICEAIEKLRSLAK